jgi:hypothetical protein
VDCIILQRKNCKLTDDCSGNACEEAAITGRCVRQTPNFRSSASESQDSPGFHGTCLGKVSCSSKWYRSQEAENSSYTSETASPLATASASAIAPSLININTNAGLPPQFADEIFNHNYIAKLHTDYLDSNPFKHAVVEKLFQDELLLKVKDECLRLDFTQK